MEYFHCQLVWLCSLPAPAHLLISWTRETGKSPSFRSNNWKHQSYQLSSGTKSKTQQLLRGKLTLSQLKPGQCLKGNYISWGFWQTWWLGGGKRSTFMLLERSTSQANVQELLCSSGLTTACPISCVVWPWETEDRVSVKVKLWDMFFMGN